MTMQDSNDVEQRSAGPAPASVSGARKTSLPPVALLLGGTVLFAAIVGFFVNPQRENDVPTMSMLTQPGATESIPTLDPTAQQTVRNDPRECRNPMGFITVATPGNPAGGNVVFRTSKYQSPVFHVTEQPQRIAIPSPLPESGGIDLLSVDGEAKGLLVSLYPTTRMEPVNGSATIKVLWRPRPPCK
jgi:hypothetical protein